MKKILLFLYLLISFKMASQKVEIMYHLNYNGFIGQYPIAFQLDFTKGEQNFKGNYYYLSKGKYHRIMLDGKVFLPTRNIEVTEHVISDETYFNNKIPTGMFILHMTNANYVGTWLAIGSTKKFNTNLKLLENSTFNPIDNYKIKALMQDTTFEQDSVKMTASKLNTLEIYNTSNQLVQEINDLDNYIGYPNKITIKYQDFNFDGYLDFCTYSFVPSLKEWTTLYFIYNPNLNEFHRDKNLQRLGSNIWFDGFNKEVQNIREMSKIDYYKWDKNDLIYLRTEDYLYE